MAGMKPLITPETFRRKLTAVRTVQAAVPTIAKQVAFLSVMSGVWPEYHARRNQAFAESARVTNAAPNMMASLTMSLPVPDK